MDPEPPSLGDASLSRVATSSPRQPPVVPDYELLRCIGRGSYGDVWLARNVLGDYRAVKFVYRDRFADPRPFEREFEGIQNFEPISRSHPSQLHILHVGKNDAAGCFYYVMELADDAKPEVGSRSELRVERGGKAEDESGKCNARPHPGPLPRGEGETSAARRQSEVHQNLDGRSMAVPCPGGEGQGGPTFHSQPSTLDPLNYVPHTLRLDLECHSRLPIPDCVQIGLSLATAMQHLHERGLVHRDIKPSNVVFVNGVAKLGDIGLVTDVGDTQSIVGTEGYLSPEGPGTPQADLYSLGKVLYEISTGMDRRRFAELPEGLRTWPDRTAVVEFNEIVLKACAKDPAQRYSSATDLQADLELLRQGQSVKKHRQLRTRLHVARRVGVSVVVILLAAIGLVALLRKVEWVSGSAVTLLNDDGTSGTRNLKAAEAYRLGLPALRRGTKEGFRQALQNFTTATVEDPRFVAAQARLFEAYLLDEDGGIDPIDGKAEMLEAAARRLQELAPASEEAHTAKAIVKFINDWKWAEAELELQQALRIDPKSRMALTYYGYLLTRLGRGKEARSLLERALEIEPTSPFITKLLGHCHFLTRNYNEALQFYLKASDLEPSYPSSHYWAGRTYLAMTNYLQAIEDFQQFELKRGMRLSGVTPQTRFAELRKAFETNGSRGFWAQAIKMEDAVERSDKAAHSAYFRAECFARIGETNRALVCLSQAIDRHQEGGQLILDEFWDGFRQHPEFQRLLNKVGLSSGAR